MNGGINTMYNKYIRKILKPILVENGYEPDPPRSLKTFKKHTKTGFTIYIEIQKERRRPWITINILISEAGEECSFVNCRLGKLIYSSRDIWWSVESSKIENSFQDIVTIIKETMLPELEKWENQEFVNEFLENPRYRSW